VLQASFTAANDLALLKANAEGRMKNEETFKPLPIAASRTVNLGGTVATVGFPDIGLQGFAPKVLAHGHHGGNRYWEVELRPGDDPRYFQISVVFADGHHAAGQMAGRASSAGG
jgi:hypothetical protein